LAFDTINLEEGGRFGDAVTAGAKAIALIKRRIKSESSLFFIAFLIVSTVFYERITHVIHTLFNIEPQEFMYIKDKEKFI